MSDVAPDDPRPEAPPAPVDVAQVTQAAQAAPPPRPLWPFMLVTLALLVAGWFLVSWMADTTQLQDCVMSGRKNCAPMDPATGR